MVEIKKNEAGKRGGNVGKYKGCYWKKERIVTKSEEERGCRKKSERERNFEHIMDRKKRDGKKLESEKRRKDRKRRIEKILPQLTLLFSFNNNFLP